jgi:hypothetical protein
VIGFIGLYFIDLINNKEDWQKGIASDSKSVVIEKNIGVRVQISHPPLFVVNIVLICIKGSVNKAGRSGSRL